MFTQFQPGKEIRRLKYISFMLEGSLLKMFISSSARPIKEIVNCGKGPEVAQRGFGGVVIGLRAETSM